jgi:hypothetical protein
MQIQQYSTQYNKFMQFMQTYKKQLEYYVIRLQDEWKYEKQTVIELIMQELNNLGPVKNYSKGNKITVAVYLGNNRLGIVELTKTKYTYYVYITK